LLKLGIDIWESSSDIEFPRTTSLAKLPELPFQEPGGLCVAPALFHCLRQDFDRSAKRCCQVRLLIEAQPLCEVSHQAMCLLRKGHGGSNAAGA
jgi:hypothetical protein